MHEGPNSTLRFILNAGILHTVSFGLELIVQTQEPSHVDLIIITMERVLRSISMRRHWTVQWYQPVSLI
jgi:hypothetical protein